MAKYIKLPKHQSGRIITTKTPYGSTSDMIVNDEEILKKISLDSDSILLKDDEGYYITLKSRIDTGLSDPNRYSETYRGLIEDKISQDIEKYDLNHKDENNG